MKIKFYPSRTSKPKGTTTVISGKHFNDLMGFTKVLLCGLCKVELSDDICFRVDNGVEVLYFHYLDNRLHIALDRKDWEPGEDYPEIEI